MPLALQWPSSLTVDWKVDPDAVVEEQEWPEEEPPPELESPAPHEEGKMAKPTSRSKSDLYAMKGPGDARGVTAVGLVKFDAVVSVSKAGMTVSEASGKPRPLADAAAFAAMLEAEPGWRVGVQVDDDVPWSKIADLAIAACGHADAWQLAPKGKL